MSRPLLSWEKTNKPSCDLGEAVSSFYSLQTVEDGLLVFSQDNKGLDTL